MLVSLNLLKKYVELPASATPEEIVAKLSACTVEVEDFFEAGKDLENIVVGKVVKLEKHPNADKLRIVRVDLGQEDKNTPARNASRLAMAGGRTQEKKEEGSNNLVKIVCGGINLYEGMLTAVALPGAMVKWHGEGESVKLEKTKIRGEESEGMICAANEIGLADRFPADELEIIDLTALDFEVGRPLARELGLDDIIIDIDNKSITNRPDLWGHYGLARELAVIYQVELKPLTLDNAMEIIKKEAKGDLKVNVKDYNLCPRYLGLVAKNVKVKESPLWLRNILTAVGSRPINNIVDITNYVMMETGQPMHAFDRGKVDNIVVRLANEHEKIMTLDKVERELTPEMLVIADSKKPIALAGVMGGQNSQIGEETKEIILEAANFNPINIRQTAQKLALRTDASMRFEKSLDFQLVETAMRRASVLLKEILPEVQLAGAMVEDAGPERPPVELMVSVKNIQTKMGVEIRVEEIMEILERLGCVVKEKKGNLTIRVPSWRSTGDIGRAEDIVEEVARIYGYERIKSEFPEVRMKPLSREGERTLINKVKDRLSLGLGMRETLNYAFWSKKLVRDWEIEKEQELLGLANPMSEEQAYLRMSLVPGLLKNISDNSRFYQDFKLYELGRVFFDRKGQYRAAKHGKERLPEQPYYLAGAVVAENDESFSQAKGVVEDLGRELGLDFLVWSAGKNPFHWVINQLTDKERRLVIAWGKEKIGWLGEINSASMEYFGIKQRHVAIFELDLTGLLANGLKVARRYQLAAKYPAVERDIAVALAWKTRWNNIKQEIEKINPLIKAVRFLSEYDLGQKKSLAWRVKYQAEDRTLTDKEVEEAEAQIIKMLAEKFGAVRR